MSGPAMLSMGRTRNGYVVRVVGRGTLKESVPLHAQLLHVMEEGCGQLVMDLSECSYLDSTFLGCLVDLHKRCRRSGVTEFFVASPSSECATLLDKTRLSTILAFVDHCPETVEEEVTVARETKDPRCLESGAHIMECHRRLAELGGPNQAQFSAIADHLARELETRFAGASNDATRS
ncbi:MAG: STAS domain-containing protein [Planctomycetota bacterium]